MESIKESNDLECKIRKLTLKGYYKNLPEPSYPKRDFIREIALKCNVSDATVRNWIIYGFRPDNPEHIKILSEATGIPENQLWSD